MTRTERQQEAIKKWIKSKGKGTIEASTGFGFLKNNVIYYELKSTGLKKF